MRIVTQFATLGVLILPWISLRGICAPVFFCHSCPWATMVCPLGVLVNFSTLKLVPFITIGILGIVGTLAGRFVCGWMCPFGALQDWLHKIPSPKINLPRQANYIKYAVLVGLVFAVPYFLPGKPYTFCDFCPSATLESTIPWAFKAGWVPTPGMFGGFTERFFMRIGILVAVLGLAVVASRGFCRTLCPLGAIFALFNRFSIFRFRLTYSKCNDCGACNKICPTEIDPVADMNGADCIRCLDCTTTKHIKMGVK